MKKKHVPMLCFIIFFTLMCSSAKAQTSIDLIITPDGNIVPNTTLLECDKNTYTFKGDISGSIWIQANNIVIDGAGYIFQGTLNLKGFNLQGHSEPECTNVVVKNLNVNNSAIRIVGGSNHTFVDNYFEKSTITSFGGLTGLGNCFKHNAFVGSSFDFHYGDAGSPGEESETVIVENDFVNTVLFVAFTSYAPALDRNYWDDYTKKYPAAKEIEGLGVWNTPYALTEQAIDKHPMVRSITGKIPDINNPLVSTLTPTYPINTNTNTATPKPSLNTNSNIGKYRIIIAIVVLIASIIASLGIILTRKRNLSKQKNGGIS